MKEDGQKPMASAEQILGIFLQICGLTMLGYIIYKWKNKEQLKDEEHNNN